MKTRPLLLDLFCGAGGASVGYHRAGFDVIGVDINPQPNYPFKFVQADAIPWLASNPCHAVHASPPCQRWSVMSKCRPELAAQYPDLITPLRPLLDDMPYVIENVVGAPLLNPIMLCGFMFGYELYRHRLFESSVPLVAPEHPVHVMSSSRAGHWVPGTVMSVSGHIAPIAHARKIMDIQWSTRAELAEAIPPYYTEYVGNQLIKVV